MNTMRNNPSMANGFNSALPVSVVAHARYVHKDVSKKKVHLFEIKTSRR